MKNVKFIALIAALVLALPGTALAQDSSVDAYNDGNNSGIQGQIEGSDDAGTPSGDSNGTDPVNQQQQAKASSGDSSLPFTGADLGIVVLAGGMLLLLGVGLRRVTQGPTRI